MKLAPVLFLLTLPGVGLACADTLAATPAWTPADGEVIAFDILRNGDKLGRHSVTFRQEGDALVAVNDIAMRYRLGPVTLFRYNHDSVETWRDGALVQFDGTTRKNGDEVSGAFARGGEGLEGAPAGTTPLTYWSLPALEAASFIIDDQFTVQPMSLEQLGAETISVAGSTVDARRYRLTAALAVDIWYDDAGRWVKSAFTLRGADFEYVAATGEG